MYTLCRRNLLTALFLFATASANAGSLINPCSLIDKSALASVMGGDMTTSDKTVLRANNDDLYDRSGDCSVASTASKGKVFFTVFVAKEAAFVAANFTQSQHAVDGGRVMPGVKTSPVSGIGERAYGYHYAYGPGYSSQDTTVSTVAGKRLVTLSLRNFPGDPSRQMDLAGKLVAQILGRL